MSGFGGGGSSCVVCQKTAFPAETIQYEKKAYHVECFQCSECKKKMDGPAGAANYEGLLFCKHCFQKGGYSQKQKNIVWTPPADAGSAAPSKFGGGGLKCTVCDKTVYAAETVSYEKKPYHAECFKCSNCVKKISPSGAAMFEEKLFCSKCFADGGYRQKQVATASKTPAQPGSSAPSKFGGGGNKCVKCDKTVYAAETVSFEKLAYHAECFKCDSCTKLIQSASGAAVFESLLLCVKCFKDGGYKQKQTNTVKEYKPSTTNAAPSKFGGGGQKCYECNTTVYAAEAISYEKKLFHGDCLKCKNCAKKVSASGAEAKRTGDEIEVYCKKCWGELGLNRASVALKKSADSSSADAGNYAAAEEPAAASYEEPAAEPAAESSYQEPEPEQQQQAAAED
jgi:cysteine/glycine-rich protein